MNDLAAVRIFKNIRVFFENRIPAANKVLFGTLYLAHHQGAVCNGSFLIAVVNGCFQKGSFFSSKLALMSLDAFADFRKRLF